MSDLTACQYQAFRNKEPGPQSHEISFKIESGLSFYKKTSIQIWHSFYLLFVFQSLAYAQVTLSSFSPVTVKNRSWHSQELIPKTQGAGTYETGIQG